MRSTVLGGEVVSIVNWQGEKTRTYVRGGGMEIAWQNGTSQNGSVVFQHRDPAGASFRSTDASGGLHTNVCAEGGPAELDQLGTNVGSGLKKVPQSWNRYVYCLNRPTVFTDPSGLIWLTNNDGSTYMWVDDKTYNKDPDKYKGYQVANGAIAKVNSLTGFNGKYDNLVGGYAQLNANGTMTGVPDPAMIVSGGDDYATIMATPAGVKFSEKFKGPPGEYRRWGPVIRWYNSDGRALVDIHHQDNHPDVGNPHIHEWDWETGQDPIKGEAKALPEWYGEAGMEDDGLPIHTPFPRGVVPQFLPAPKYQPRPIFAPDPAAKPLPVRPTAPLRLPFPTLRPVLP